MDTWYSSGYLADALIEAGIVNGKSAKQKAQQWITKAEQAGKIKPYKMPSHSGSMRRKFREEDIEEIVKAFSIGGSGYWEPKPL